MNTDDLARRYAAGESMKNIADSYGVHIMTVYGRLRRAGVEMRPAGGRKGPRVQTPDDLVDTYVAGESELSISLRTGISRPTVRRRLLAAGVKIRSGSEANVLRMARMTPEARLALTDAAHTAVRGKPQSIEHRVKTALTIEANPGDPSKYEAEFSDLMNVRHPQVALVRQKAVGPYNLDFALCESRVAVEIFGGNWHTGGRHGRRYRKRTDYLIDAGWLPVIIWVKDAWPLTEFAADYVVSLHERIRGGEPRGRQEHVIRGNGDLGPVGEFKPDDGAIILNFNPGNSQRGGDGRFRQKA